MTGNEVGDRVHNFFAQDNLSQGQHHSQVDNGSWQDLWAGSNRHISLPSSNSKEYNSPQADIERGHSSYSFPVSHGLNHTQSTRRPEFGKSQSQIQQPNLNGYMHGRQISQTTQNQANFLGMDTESDCNNMTPRGLSTYRSQQGNGPDNYTTSIRSQSSESPVSFDFFGSEQQMSGRQTGMLQSLPQQQSGFNEMQLVQQQVMLRKMQELQRQQQIQQLEARHQNSINQMPFITKQASSSHSPALINGTPISPIAEASNYSWSTEPPAGNTNWLQRGTPAFQGSSNGFRFPLEQGQALNLMGLVPQQVDQSLYGVPISDTRGTSHEYSHIPLDKSTVQQLTMYNNSFLGNQYTGFSDQVSMQDGSLLSRQGFQGENMFGHGSGQGHNSVMNLENLQQVNALPINAPLQEFHEKQELVGPSETLKEKPVMHVSSSQNAVALDPTEEKILFGDDNIWDAFGSSANIEAGDFNLFNGTGSLNGFPSLQSGTWSALMQSAVAETSSNDIVLQEEWSGPSFEKSEVQVANRQSAAYENNTKQDRVLSDNKLGIASALSSGSVPLSHDANIYSSYSGVPGFQQPGQRFSYENGERLQMDSARRPIQQSSEEGSKWLSRGPLQKPPAERSQIYGNAHSLDTEINAKSTSGSWPHQQSVSFYNSSQPQDKADVRGVGESDATLKIHENKNKLPHSYDDMSRGGHMWNADSSSNSAVGWEQVKSAMGSPQVNQEEYKLSNVEAIPDSTTARASHDNSQLLPNSHHLNYWNHADSSIKRSENSVKSQHHLNKGSQVLELSTKSSENDAVKMHESENCDRKENSSDSHHTNLTQHAATGGSRVNVALDGSDSRCLAGGKQKSSVRKASGPCKFQYHPMGNLDEDLEPSYGKNATHSQVMSQQIPRASQAHNQAYFGQSNFFGQFPRTSSEVEKGHIKGHDEAPSRGTLPAFSPSNSAPFDRSVTLSAPNKAGQSSQNMLELLHKVDQPQERGNSDGSVGHLQQNQFSVSQGFSLQLAPPSQWPAQNRALASQGSGQTDSLTSPERRDKGHAWLPSTAQVQSLPQSRSQLPNQQMMGSGGKLTTNQPRNVSFDRHPSHFQRTGDPARGALTGQSTPASLPDTTGVTPNDKPVSSGDTSKPIDTRQSHERISSPQGSVGRALPSSQPFNASGISQQGALPKMVPNAWTNVPGQHHLFGAQPHKFPQSTLQSSQSNNNVVSTSLTQQDREDQDAGKGGNFPSGNTDLAEKMSSCQGTESVVKNPSEASPLNSASTLIDIEAFGRSLKPNNLLHQSYSLLHQMQAMKNTEIGPSNRGFKKLKGADSDLGGQIAPEAEQLGELNVMVGDSLVRRNPVPSGNSSMLSFSGPVDNRERNSSSLHGNIPSQGVLASGRKDSDSYSYTNNTTSARVEHSQISPQMAPSWFNQFGTFKNGQMSSIFDAQKNAIVKTVEQPYALEKSSDSLCVHNPLEQVNAIADSTQVDNKWQRSTPTSVAMECFSSPRLPALDVADPCLAVGRPKKRKGATSELLPWHKDVTQGSQSLLTISMSEVDWAKAGNRLIDKVECEAEMIEDGPPILRPKRRLILTTQLMQQLFRPPPLAVLSADASSNYETMAYLVARLALGDACSLIPGSGSDSFAPFDSNNLSSDKRKTSERTDGQHLLEVMEDFLGRARKLEKDFMRLDKGVSVVDARIECQELEKFSVINRFAKFHGRGQVDGGETSSSSSAAAAAAAAANAQRPFPQRYVTALPVPRTLPDRVQCLSL